MDISEIILVGFGTIMSVLGWSLSRNFNTTNRVLAKLGETVEKLGKSVEGIDKKIVAAETHMQHTNANIESIIKKIDKIEQHEKQLGIMEYRLEQQEITTVTLNAKREELERHIYATHSVR